VEKYKGFLPAASSRFKSYTIIAFSLIAAASFVFFLLWELTERDPIVDLRLLGRRQFGIAFLIMMTVGAILFGSNQILPQLLQTSFPYTAELSGLAVMPGGLAMLLLMPVAGQVTGLMQPKYWIAIGLGGVALAMWYSTSLTPDATFWYFAKVRIFQVIGLPFLFIPINAIAYEGLPQNKTSEGSALINVARNLGGSVGVSLANTELLRRSQFHQSRLVENMIPSSPVFHSTLQRMTQYFTHQGAPPTAAQSHAFGVIGQTVASQATLMAYIDVFYTWAIFTALLVPVVLLAIKRVSGPVRAAAH